MYPVRGSGRAGMHHQSYESRTNGLHRQFRHFKGHCSPGRAGVARCLPWPSGPEPCRTAGIGRPGRVGVCSGVMAPGSFTGNSHVLCTEPVRRPRWPSRASGGPVFFKRARTRHNGATWTTTFVYFRDHVKTCKQRNLHKRQHSGR